MFDELYDVCAHEHRKINEWYIRDVENVASLLETFFSLFPTVGEEQPLV